jgi:hypothetical protein
MNTVRFLGGALLGVGSAIGVFMLLVSIDLPLWRVAGTVLVPAIVAGVIGGFISGLVAPHHKVLLSTTVGIAISTVMLAFLLRNGLSHSGRNPFFWYWPAWVAPSFLVGGILSRRMGRAV